MPKATFNDFSGGLSDFRFNTASNFSENMINWIVNRDKSMEVRYGFGFLDLAAPRVLTNKRVNAIRDLDDTLVYFSDANIYHMDSGMQEVTGPTLNPIFHQADQNTITDIAQWGKHYICVDDSHSFPIKLYKDENGNIKAVNAGLPKVISEPIIAPSSPAANKVSYAFVYEYEYLIGTTKFIDQGEPLYLSIDNGSDLYTGTNEISAYLELTNGVNRNYDVVNIRKKVYRTPTNGTTFYHVDDIDNSVEIFSDDVADDVLVHNAVLYTQGGIKPNELPPQSKYITISNNVAFYGNIVESAEVKPYRLKFSKIADPDSVPASFFEDFESEITGLSSIDDRVIVFTENKAIALEGQVDDLGRGSYSRRSIADVGCLSNGSIITTQDYVYWFSDSGIMRTNGIQKEKLTLHLDLSFQNWTNTADKKRRIYGSYDKVNQRVYWCINEADSDNDKILVYDEIHGGFSSFSSGVDFSPTAIFHKDQEMVRADKDGYVFIHKEDIYSDLVKDQFTAVGEWNQKAIPYNWKHIAWDFGDGERTKWVTKIGIVGRPKTNIYLEPRTYREGGVDYFALGAVTFNPLMKWGDPTLKWGDVANRWNSVDYLNIAKRMNRKAKRVTHMQLSLASAYIVIQQSVTDPDSRVLVNATTRAISLINPSIYSFSLGNKGYDMWIEGKSYNILSSSVDTVIVDDPGNNLVDGTFTFEIKGYPKSQRPHISDISVHYEVFGNSDKLQESAS